MQLQGIQRDNLVARGSWVAGDVQVWEPKRLPGTGFNWSDHNDGGWQAQQPRAAAKALDGAEWCRLRLMWSDTEYERHCGAVLWATGTSDTEGTGGSQHPISSTARLPVVTALLRGQTQGHADLLLTPWQKQGNLSWKPLLNLIPARRC